MIESDKPNPFQVLGLPTNAPMKQVVERGRDVDEEAATEEERQLCRWAIEQLRTNRHTRLEYEIFEVPDTHYQNTEWDALARAYKINPVDLAKLAKEPPPIGLENFDLSALLRLLLDGVLNIPEADITDVTDGSVLFPGYGPPPLEVQDVLFG